MTKPDVPDPDFGPPAPIIDPASVRWVCGTVLALGTMALAGWVAWANPDLAMMVAEAGGAGLAILFMLLITR